MLRIHSVESGLRKGSEKISSWAWSEQEIVFIPLLHGAVVSKGCRIKAHAVEPHLAPLQLPDPLTDLITIQAAREEAVGLHLLRKAETHCRNRMGVSGSWSCFQSASRVRPARSSLDRSLLGGC